MKRFGMFIVLFIATSLMLGCGSKSQAFNPFYTAEDQQLFMEGLMKKAPPFIIGSNVNEGWRATETGKVEVFYRPGSVRSQT